MSKYDPVALLRFGNLLFKPVLRNARKWR